MSTFQSTTFFRVAFSFILLSILIYVGLLFWFPLHMIGDYTPEQDIYHPLGNRIISDTSLLLKQNVYPSLVIIGSTKSGTSTLHYLLTHLQSFQNSLTYDLNYWTVCKWCESSEDRPSLKCNFMDPKIKKNIVSIHDIAAIWNVNIFKINNSALTRYKCTAEHYMQTITDNRYNASKYIKLYSMDRSSMYMNVPFIPKLYSLYFPDSILLYSIREKISQQYSRFNYFCIKSATTHRLNEFERFPIPFGGAESFNFEKLIKWDLEKFQSNEFENILYLINNSEQTETIRNEIVYQYITYPRLDLLKYNYSMEGDKTYLIFLHSNPGDICPYLNVLVYIKLMELYNVKYGFAKLKLIQFEWIYENIMQTTVYLQCIVKIKNSSSMTEFNECVNYYSIGNRKNLNRILTNESQIQLSDNGFNQRHDQKFINYTLSDIKLFDEWNEYLNICDRRLFELIAEERYKHLIIGTDWNYDRWLEKEINQRPTSIYCR
eukprot:158988_1